MIDYLILNAGIATVPQSLKNSNDECITDKDKLNIVFATNHFGHWLITYKLFDLLIESSQYRIQQFDDETWKSTYGAPTRVITVSSGAHRGATYGLYDKIKTKEAKSISDVKDSDFDFDKYFQRISKGKQFSDCNYSASKLLNIYHMQYMQRILNQQGNGDNIWCTSITPGMVRTPIFAKFSKIANMIFSTVLFPLLWFISRDIRMGSQVILHCCGSNDSSIADHCFWSNCVQGRANDSLKRNLNQQVKEGEHLWQSCKKLLTDIENSRQSKL